MADVSITSLTALGGAPATDDELVIVDVSDHTQAPTGTTKNMTVANLFTSPTLTGTTTLASLSASGSVQASGAGYFSGGLKFNVGGTGGGVPICWLSTIATATVSTTPVALSSLSFGKGGLIMVYGTDGSNTFLDLVLYGAATTQTISSITTGTPAARTYSMAANVVQLAVASGSYAVDTTEIAKGN